MFRNCLALAVCWLGLQGEAVFAQEEPVSLWLERLGSANPLLREEGLLLLGRDGDETLLPRVQPLLKDPVVMVRVRAAMLVAQWGGDASATRVLAEGIKNLPEPGRADVFRTMLAQPSAACLPWLREQILGKDLQISRQAGEALAQLGPAAGPVVWELLEQEGRQQQLVALSILRDMRTEALPLLLELRRRMPKLNPALRSTALNVLALDPAFGKNKDDLDLIMEGIKVGSASDKQQAFHKLMTYRPLPKEMAAAFIAVMEQETGDARWLAAAALAELAPDHPGLLDSLVEALGSINTFTAGPVLQALEKFGPLPKPALDKVVAVFESATFLPARQPAAAVLAGNGKAAIAPLERILVEASKTRKRNDLAARTLGSIPEATSTIVRLLEEDEPELNYHMAVALAAAKPKPPEALELALRLFVDRDTKIRRLALDYLVDVKTDSPALTEGLLLGLEDPGVDVARRCLAALQERQLPPAEWLAAVTKYVQHPGGPSVSGVVLLADLDPRAAQPFVLRAAMKILERQHYRPSPVFPLAALDKQLLPVMPKIYGLWDRSPKVRLNVITLLAFLPAEFSQPVHDKLTAALDDTDVQTRLMAARALLKSDKADKERIARALAEVATAPKLPLRFCPDEPLKLLCEMGVTAKPAAEILENALPVLELHCQTQTMITIATLDPERTATLTALAKRMHRGPASAEKTVGAAVLCYLHEDAEALKTLKRALADPLVSQRMLEWLGPKAKSLAPRLQAIFDDPRNLYPAHTALALARIDGDLDKAVERLLDVLENRPTQRDNAYRALGKLGPAARAAVPAMLESARHTPFFSEELAEALMHIDPAVLGRVIR